MLKLFLISNMYPSTTHPFYGVFVKNFEDQALNTGIVFTHKAVITKNDRYFISKFLTYIGFYLKILFILSRKNYDIVYVHYVSHVAPILLFARLFSKKNTVLNVHGSDIISISFVERFLIGFTKTMLHKADLVVAPSVFLKTYLIGNLKLDPHKIFVSPSAGINMNLFKPNTATKEKIKRQSELKTLCIGYVSTIDNQKGIDVFLDAVENVSLKDYNLKAIIAGKESTKDSIKNRILPENIIYYGEVNHQKLPELYNTFDLFVFPTKLYESLGLVGLEAMSCGVPVIGSRIGGLTDYIKHGYNGFLFEPGDHEELKKLIIQYSNMDDAKKETLANNALETARSYKADTVALKMKDKLTSLIGGPI